MTWLILVLITFKEIGLLNSAYMKIGPNPDTHFMGVCLNDWHTWGMVAMFTFINTTINDYMSDSIGPWILNSISDHKSRYLPYSKFTCLVITQLWSAYCCIMGVLGLMISLTQIDFVLIRMAADLMVNMYTTYKFMQNKEVNPERYYSYMQLVRPTHNNDNKEEELVNLHNTNFSIDDDDLEEGKNNTTSSSA
jgi:hypothetical protein